MQMPGGKEKGGRAVPWPGNPRRGLLSQPGRGTVKVSIIRGCVYNAVQAREFYAE